MRLRMISIKRFSSFESPVRHFFGTGCKLATCSFTFAKIARAVKLAFPSFSGLRVQYERASFSIIA